MNDDVRYPSKYDVSLSKSRSMLWTNVHLNSMGPVMDSPIQMSRCLFVDQHLSKFHTSCEDANAQANSTLH